MPKSDASRLRPTSAKASPTPIDAADAHRRVEEAEARVADVQ